MTLLEASTTALQDSAHNAFLEYGILGIMALFLGYFAYQQYQRLIKKNDKLEEKIDKLQTDMMNILVEERDRMSELVRENTSALAELQKTILEYMVKHNQ
jgi:hypothetical protein